MGLLDKVAGLSNGNGKKRSSSQGDEGDGSEEHAALLGFNQSKTSTPVKTQPTTSSNKLHKAQGQISSAQVRSSCRHQCVSAQRWLTYTSLFNPTAASGGHDV